MLIDYASELERRAAAMTERAALIERENPDAAKGLRQRAAELRREAARGRAKRTAWHPRRRLLDE